MIFLCEPMCTNRCKYLNKDKFTCISRKIRNKGIVSLFNTEHV